MEGKKHNVALAGFLITIIGSILFSTKAIIVKKAFANTHMDAVTLLMLRMTFSLPFYIGAIWFARQEGLAPLTGRQWLGVIGLGLFGYYLSSMFDFIGLQYVTAGLERLILFLYPTFAVFINAFVFKQPVIRTQKIALLLTYTGIGIAYLGELNIDISNPNFLWGSFLIFLCSITYSIYIVGSGRMIPTVGATRFTAYAMLAATAGVFAHFIFKGGTWQVVKESTSHVGYGLLLAIVATVLPTFMM
ncbi:MAG TPA: DMT family transporter, partial [Niastella sp.]|nr:DMT family transporter [Niastella sp.]